VSRRRRVQGWLLTRDLAITAASVLFSLWVTFAAGYSAVYQAMVVVLAGIILYAFLNARRDHSGQVTAPAASSGPDPAAEPPAGS
jgi:APA family basic amino acid/polyamine antiporter